MTPDSCGICHYPVLEEWRQSQHSVEEVSCEVCHGIGHSAQILRAGECRRCHPLTEVARAIGLPSPEPHRFTTVGADSVALAITSVIVVVVLIAAGRSWTRNAVARRTSQSRAAERIRDVART